MNFYSQLLFSYIYATLFFTAFLFFSTLIPLLIIYKLFFWHLLLMEEVSFIYSAPHNVIICQVHGFALLTPTIKQYLQQFHRIEISCLQEVWNKTYLKAPALFWEQVLTPPNVLPPVAGLNIIPGFKCNFKYCSLKAERRSANKRTIIQYLKKAHQLSQDTLLSIIIKVDIQIFFPSLYSQLFIVSLPVKQGTITSIPNSSLTQSDNFLQQLQL